MQKRIGDKLKVKVIVSFLLAITLLIGVVVFLGCSPSHERLANLISELRDNIFEGESESFRVSIITGVREEPFLLDGTRGQTQDFTLITLMPKVEISGSVSVRARINDTLYSGEFTKHPFSNTLSVEFPVRAPISNPEIVLHLTYGGKEENIAAKSVLTYQMIDYQKALEIAENKLRNSIEVFKVGGELQCEIFIRLIPNGIDNAGGFHWYVAFIGSDQTIFAVLIEPITMQVVAIRN
ncbi:MAG: hypothetical protein FWE13_03905 [Firmicutes bacterium]|nr:hypothetical protein [Bacillota bacterium]